MAVRFGTEAWAEALREEINGSSEYKNAAVRWGDGFNGDMVFVFEGEAGADATRRLLIRLAGGRCKGAEFIDDEGAAGAAFVLRAPMGLWRQILERKAMAATAILTGKMKVDGDKMTLLKHTAANRALIHCTASLETSYD